MELLRARFQILGILFCISATRKRITKGLVNATEHSRRTIRWTQSIPIDLFTFRAFSLRPISVSFMWHMFWFISKFFRFFYWTLIMDEMCPPQTPTSTGNLRSQQSCYFWSQDFHQHHWVLWFILLLPFCFLWRNLLFWGLFLLVSISLFHIPFSLLF